MLEAGARRRLSAGRRLRGRPAGSRRHGERCRRKAGGHRLGGAVPDRAVLDAAWPGWDDGVTLSSPPIGRPPAAAWPAVARWVGDGDSIGSAELDALAASGVSIGRVPAEKDESDAELALGGGRWRRDRDRRPRGLGRPRVDHALANVGLLAHPALDGRPACLYDERGARISLLVAPELGLASEPGDGPVCRERGP